MGATRPKTLALPEEQPMTSNNQRTKNDQQLDRSLPPSESQAKYLRYLLVRAHELGVPYLPVEALSRGAVSAWIDYLRTVTGEFEEEATASPSSSGGAA
jgi:hypothetical protein